MNVLPPFITRSVIAARLPLIFPEGTQNRNYCIREMAASTIFTLLYIGAVDGSEIYLAPVHVYRMSSQQASLESNEDRMAYGRNALKKGFQPQGIRWYADNTREPIRDETLREGLQQVGAVMALTNLPTTSSRPRYCLQKEFALLFDPGLDGESLLLAIANWQIKYLSAGARARITLANRSAKANSDRVLITFPNGEARNFSAGLSSEISKSVIEVFAPRFLTDPAVLWISTSDVKVPYLDNEVASAIGLNIKADKDLPDVIIVDLGTQEPLVVFVEVVATDGAITDRRQLALHHLTDNAGFHRKQVIFVTAYHDRQSAGFKKTISGLAWGSYAWFASEPDNIVSFQEGVMKIDPLN
jgi:hypothetical protein